MIPIDVPVVMNDPVWLVFVKAVLLLVGVLVWTIMNVWVERRFLARMMNRVGPSFNGPMGLLQTVAEGVKLLIKEDFSAKHVDKVVFTVAPVLLGASAFSAWMVIPMTGQINLFGVQTRLQLVDAPIAVLISLAIASVGIYGIVLAGWSSRDSYSLLGALRSSAQMISYEISMGLALVSVFLWSGSMSTSQIVEAQATHIVLFGFDTSIPAHHWLILLPAFVIYGISCLGEANRRPFDLAEAEQELVSGHITEYTGFRYAMYYLGEYINMATVSALITTLFLGGYRAPWPFNLITVLDQGWFGLLWFFVKTQLCIVAIIWIRGTIPRFRYDQFMAIGWKVLTPVALATILVVTAIKGGVELNIGTHPAFIAGAVVFSVLLIAWLVWGIRAVRKHYAPERVVVAPGAFDAFAGGYPVPPMPGQELPELAGVVRGQADEATPAGLQPAQDKEA